MKYFLKVCLWTQVFAFIFATLLFGALGDSRLAGSLTGPVFVLSGALPFLGYVFRRLSWHQVSVWVSLIFTLFFSGPMLLKRFMMYGVNFSELTYYGWPAALFHRASSVAYLILFLTLLWDFYKTQRKAPAV